MNRKIIFSTLLTLSVLSPVPPGESLRAYITSQAEAEMQHIFDSIDRLNPSELQAYDAYNQQRTQAHQNSSGIPNQQRNYTLLG